MVPNNIDKSRPWGRPEVLRCLHCSALPYGHRALNVSDGMMPILGLLGPAISWNTSCGLCFAGFNLLWQI